MIGGDLPGWLGTLFRKRGIAALTDQRGECVYAGCPHCRQVGASFTLDTSKLCPLPIEGFMYRWGVDLFGPVKPKTGRGVHQGPPAGP